MSVINSSGSSWQNPGDPNQTPPKGTGAVGVAGVFAVRFNAVPLVNGTPIIASLPVPNDGNEHIALVTAYVNTTTTEVGGGITAGITTGAVTNNPTVNSGSNTPGISVGSAFQACDPGSVVTVKQLTALTSGAATITGSIVVI